MHIPSRDKNIDGRERHIGVELEFAALSSSRASQLIQQLFGGELIEEQPHRHFIKETRFGDFECKLDWSFLHRESDTPPDSFDRAFLEIMGDIGAAVVPCEIVSPPIPYSDLPEMDKIVEALRDSGAAGTDDNIFYAFGMQLNPDIPSRDPAYLTAMIQAYLLCSDWLRAEIRIDPTRWLLPYADSFSTDYARRVCAPDYQPDLSTLIDDYLTFNPTRNRELDLLPLFSWLDRDRVFSRVDDPRIKPRPTYHYRLPNAQLGDPGWSIGIEWQRWLAIERLAEDDRKRRDMAAAYLASMDDIFDWDWAEKSRQWIMQ
ncbi:amidoligase family protein [Aestuariispira insulae]|uniref:Putative amidoligase enzyme n=1 Tax=Aestuariispira insulae TaxID=1461337 RepID=A0A3D9H1K4_9PROT|nr:amidoligase family protein [Aestuariispira insulae]RED43375.1 putative amidoligase enzyme [Aestuariispira insulae]